MNININIRIAQDDPTKKLERLALVKKDVEGRLENNNTETKSINESIDELR